ncbi:MAG: S-layer homology domain-containing protein, partial [Clostridiales bacterium]|nr:S-layer homology domain-containing protein [Clostridiales bacterium]
VGHTLNSINNWLPCLVDCTFAEGADPIYYFAQWEANRYTATFMDDDGSTLLGQVKEIAYGTTVAAGNGGIPDDPIKDGYNFDGWDDGVVTSSDVSKYLVTEHVTFTAKYVEIADAIVVFDYNGGRDDEGKSSKIISGKPGDPYDPPPLPIRDGYTLDTPKSWLTERAEEPGGTFGEAGSSVTYFAQWTPNTYTVTFEAGINGKMTPENPEEPGIYSESVRHGDGVKIVPHIDPNSGYNFPGWSISGDESTYVEETILKMPITGNITFVAKYQLKTSNPPGDTKTETATLTVRAIDNASGAVIPPVITTPILVGERKKIPAPVIPGYDLAEDCQPTKEVTIIAGDNTVDFFYNKKNEPPGPGGSSVSDKIKEVLETQKHISYINGYPDGSVKPDNNITRAEVAIIFWRLLKSPEKNYPVTAAFSDIKGDESYAQAVKYLAQMGIIQGYEDGSFRPSRGITRAEFVAIACRFDDLENSNINPFTDLTGSHWAYAYIISANLKGWISGYPDGEFKPQNNISRAEAVKIINRMLGRGINLADLPIDLPGYTDLKQSHWAYCEIMEATVSHEFERYLDGQFKGWEIWK